MKRKLVILLILVMLVSGCGNTPNLSTSVSSFDDNTISSVDVKVDVNEPQVDVEAPQKQIEDFYEYAVGEWVDSVDISKKKTAVSYGSETDDAIRAQVVEMVRNMSSEDFPDDVGMQRLLQFIDQLNSDGMEEKAAEEIKKMYEEIESVKSIKEFYELLTESDYAGIDPFFGRRYEFTNQGNYVVRIMPFTYNKEYFLNADEKDFIQREFAKEFQLMGEPEDVAMQKAENAVAVNDKITELYFIDSNDMYMDEENYDSSEHAIPILDLLEKMGYAKYDYGKNEYYSFFIFDSTLEFYDTMFKEENLQMFKDYMEVNLFYMLFDMGTMEMKEIDAKILSGLSGYPLDEVDEDILIGEDYNREEDAIMMIADMGEGRIAKLYRDKYVTDAVISEIEEMTSLVKDKLVEMVKEYTWLSDRGKEKLISKIKTATFFYGENSGCATYDDVVIGENSIQTILSFMASDRKQNKERLVAEGGMAKDSINLFETNAEYSCDSNSVLLTFGVIKWLMDNSNASFEEKLGMTGCTIAHELSHSVAPMYIDMGRDGIYLDFYSDEEYEVIWNSSDAAAAVIDGFETDYGNVINGYACSEEFFTDLLSIDCCMRILGERENADYDKFFVNYAKGYAMAISPTTEESILRKDTHIPGKPRVNLALYQFDELYETYCIAEDNKYYVKPEERVTGYK